MNYHNALDYIWKNCPKEVANAIMERLGPAGSSPAAGSRTREAGRGPDAVTMSPQPERSRTEEGVELQRLADYLEEEAGFIAHGAECAEEDGNIAAFRELESQSADLKCWASLVLALRAEPLTKSEEEGDESCPCCKSPGTYAWVGTLRKCRSCDCLWDKARRLERSVSGNSEL